VGYQVSPIFYTLAALKDFTPRIYGEFEGIFATGSISVVPPNWHFTKKMIAFQAISW
jgi:hypothetical protein